MLRQTSQGHGFIQCSCQCGLLNGCGHLIRVTRLLGVKRLCRVDRTVKTTTFTTLLIEEELIIVLRVQYKSKYW